MCLLICCGHAAAEEKEASEEALKEVRQAVIKRCRDKMAEYGAAMVKGCVDIDMEAYEALEEYPAKYQSIVNRCKKSMDSYGWAMVKGCADMDIEAEQALEAY